MRKVIVQMQSSIDGFVAGPSGDVSWAQWSWGPDWTWPKSLQEYHTNTVSSADEVLLSDVMAEEGFIDHWATIAQDNTNPEAKFATAITKAHKTIFSHKKLTPHWENSSLAREDMPQTVTSLKRQAGRNIIAFGGVRFATALLEEGLVDELHLIMNPITLSNGLSIFNTGKEMQFSLIEATSHQGGIVVLRYAPR